ncbi:MAG: hypothetical protein IKZ76_02110 [Lachnospiraceae bacterium]|nr:hypothetical protein [Lachnospiraceae bacterium]MBR5916853.1 hypothetical protein [Lachnospiraceae bacterium]
MVLRCANCGGVLEYSAELNKMVCSFCGSSYTIEELNEIEKAKEAEIENITQKPAETAPSNSDNRIVKGSTIFTFKNSTDFSSDEVGDWNTILKKKNEEKAKEESRMHASVKMQIMRCTSCGAELAVNGVETSTFCAYCGQATVVSDRVDDYLKPDYIIPFKVTRDEAEKTIRMHLNKGFFVPKGIKNFEVEKIRGIYVPFWLFDMQYSDRQFYKYTKKQGKSSVTRYEYFEAKTVFKQLTLDASLNLNDDSSARLEPYDMRQLQEFDIAYLSGYYSDRFDVGVADSTGNAVLRAGELFNEEVQREMKHKGAKLVKNDPDFNVWKTDYALLPAWFLSFKYDDKPYTILVNGQTGKMVGAVPYVKFKAYSIFAVVALLLCALGIVVCTALSYFFFIDVGFDEKITWAFTVGLPVVIFLISRGALDKFNALKKSLSLTTASKINQFAKERQDR